ncbi:MAG: energy transducer TonB [Bdellovibrionia bacterium]
MNRRLLKLIFFSIALHAAIFAAFTVSLRTQRMDMPSPGESHIGPLAIEVGGEPKTEAPSHPASKQLSSQQAVTTNSSAESAHPESGASRGSNSGPVAINSSDPYYSEIRARIESHIHYPPAFARRRLQGQVQVTLTLLSNGSISSLDVAHSSGTSELDQLALDSVRAASPFPTFESTSPARKLELPITFRLR